MAKRSRIPRRLAAAAEQRLSKFTVEVPSWGFADTGTRFGKFFQPAAAITISVKRNDHA